MTEVEHIIARLRDGRPVFEKKYGVKTLGVFGSYVRGQQGKRSDVDILVEFKRPVSLLEFLSLEQELSELLGRKVDLVMKSALKPKIGEHILREVVKV